MEFTYITRHPLQAEGTVVAVAVGENFESDPSFKSLDSSLGGTLLSQAKARKFSGKSGQSLVAYSGDNLSFSFVALVGTGNRGSSDLSACRDAAAVASNCAASVSADSMVYVLPKVSANKLEAALQLSAEGAALGSYRFDKYQKQKNPSSLESVSFATAKGGKATKGIKSAIAKGQAVATAIAKARDFVNEPAAAMTPSILAGEAKAIAKAGGLTIKVLGRKECEKLGMGMYLAVAQGSDEEPKLIHMTYKPKRKAKKVVALVGKGVTFDSGGYSLKPSAAMLDMKIDMAGSAAVISSMLAIAEIGSPYEVHAIAACAENMVSGDAYKLGDVLTAMDGTTVEINNTDAEGRLTLGDAITYVREKIEPDEIFDFATLTGACMVALGPYTAAVMSDTESLAKGWLGAAKKAGEHMWRLPLNKRLKAQLKSSIADLRNTGERWGGAITAGLFLQHFAKDSKWLHVDIAGPASVNSASGATAKGGTGFAVATIVEYLCD